MSKIRIVYLYLVCSITLFMAVAGFISSIQYLATYLYPTSYYTTKYYDSYYDQEDDDDYYKTQEKNDKIRNLKSSINSFAFVAVGAPIYVYHWSKIEKERKEREV